MNRRGFLGLLGKVLAVGAAMGVAPNLIEKAEIVLKTWTYEWVQVGGPSWQDPVVDGATYAFEVRFTPGDGPKPAWAEMLEDLHERVEVVGVNKFTLAS